MGKTLAAKDGMRGVWWKVGRESLLFDFEEWVELGHDTTTQKHAQRITCLSGMMSVCVEYISPSLATSPQFGHGGW